MLAGELQSLQIRTDVTRDELFLLYRLAKSVRDGDIVEIGSYLGASACFLAAGAAKARASVYCIDTWKNDAMTEGPRDTFAEFVRNTEHHRSRIMPVRAWSTDAARELSVDVGLLFVDGDHSTDAVAADLRAWLPKVRTGGWLALHDSGWAEGVQAGIAGIVEPLRVGDPIQLPNLYVTRIRSPR
jgi:predicted O-methyltransferase YrrM